MIMPKKRKFEAWQYHEQNETERVMEGILKHSLMSSAYRNGLVTHDHCFCEE